MGKGSKGITQEGRKMNLPWWIHTAFWTGAILAYLGFVFHLKAKREAATKGITLNKVEGFPEATKVLVPTFGSPIEKRLYEAIQKTGLPLPVLQFEIYNDGRLVTVPDFAYPAARIAIYCDGHDYHSSRDQMTGDASKRNFLQVRGWVVLVFTGSAIHSNPGRCVSTIKQAITNRR